MDYKCLAGMISGENCTVKEICGGCNCTKRLYELGFNTGAKINIVKNDRGPIIVSICGNKIALGRGLAEKILVNLG